MIKLNIKGFRCFKSLSLSFNTPLVIFVGRNASGKTSILESIYLTCTTKSHRTNNYLEMINKNSDIAKISLTASNKLQEIVLSKEGKHFFYRNTEIKMLKDYLNKSIKCIMMSPYDLKLATGTKADKRQFLDANLAMLDDKYLTVLLDYKKLLKKRNELLKNRNYDINLFNVITIQLVNTIFYINNRRNLFVNKINEELIEISQNMQLEGFKIKCNLDLDKDSILKSLEKSLSKDLHYKSTSYGPHRDDFELLINDDSIKAYASSGQQKSLVIALKLAVYKLLQKKFGDNVLLLLDELFAKLDSTRQKALVGYLKNTKCFITTTSLIELPEELLKEATVYKLE